MKSENMSKIQEEFTKQARGFASSKMNFTKQEYLDYMIKHMELKPTDNVLEVAAGICICGRAVSPFAGHVTCLDMTPAAVCDMITERMRQDIQGGAKTGFYPYMKNGRIQFNHRWLMCLGYK